MAIYISYGLLSCHFCEKIAVFYQGRIVHTDSHEELLRDTKGEYRKLWDAQARYYR